MKVVCAWCERRGEAGDLGERAPFDNPGIAHGFCLHHAGQLLESLPSRSFPDARVLIVVPENGTARYEFLQRRFAGGGVPRDVENRDALPGSCSTSHGSTSLIAPCRGRFGGYRDMASATIGASMRQRAMRHAATDVCRLSTAAIFRQPSIRRSVICPLTTRLKSRISAASSLGSEPCVFTRRRNSPWSRSITFVVRNVFHCALGKLKKVRSSSPPSRRLVTTPGQRLAHVRSKAA